MNLIARSIFFFFFFFFLLLCNSSPSHSPQTTASTDRIALLHFKSLLTDPTNSLSSWNSSLPFCQWQGINCSITGRVTRLRLVSLQLAGPISPSISNLTFLESLGLSDNNLVGPIPAEIDRLSNLVNLTLKLNYLSGEIPASIVRCSNLQFVSLWSNLFTGEIPREIGLMSKLQGINLLGNNITGTIPVSIGNISSLRFVVLAGNELVGTIPESMGRLANLQSLQMERNKFTGELPLSFFNLSSLYDVYLGLNNLEGTLPSSMFDTLPNLEHFLLKNNHFYGSIPASVSNASYLIELDLSTNGFSGIIPSKLGNSQYLWWVQISSNQLEANEVSDWDFMESLTNCSYLVTLEMSDNRLGGVLPASLANLSSSAVTVLSISNNSITGNIPAEIGNLVNLTAFNAHDNLLTGSLPSSIGKLKSLHRLSLSRNKFNGQIPDSMSNLFELNQLYLHNNLFDGSIPASFGKLENLQEMDLSWNRFSGEIPKEVLQLRSLSVYLDLSNNLLSGSLPAEIGKLTNLNWFSASNNNLSGKIPSGIGNCLSMEYLYLQSNSFQGTIPQSLSNLKGLRELDLSSNNLDQNIPMFFEKFKVLQLLNLSFNELEGQVPANGVFKNSTAVSLYGNKRLCGGDSKLHLPSCDHEPSNNSNGRKHLKLALKIVIPVVGVLCLAFGFFIFIGLRRAKRMQKKLSFNPMEGQFRRTSYAELLKATNEFSSSNLLGVGSFGSVYKGIIEPGETIVAVKVLNLERQGASKSFMAECEALRDIRHRNLVKILTACSSVDFSGNSFKALVLKYMPNGSLDQWLHQKQSNFETNMLSFLQRLSIAIDVASALDYLHNLGHAPIVHCDLKPSNVLLDEEMCAHLGDFGLARILLDMDDNQTASIGIKGTIGYVPPEYGMGYKSSPQGDVYSYGILLLELFTGRRPTDEIFQHGVNLRNYVESAQIDQFMEIIDPCLIAEAQNRIQDSRLDTT